MQALKDILPIVVVGFFVVGGQALLTIFSRGISTPIVFRQLVTYALTSPALYGAVVVYGIGLTMYIWMLRRASLSAMNLTIMVTIVCCTLLYDHFLGNDLAPRQYVGAMVVVIGLMLLH